MYGENQSFHLHNYILIIGFLAAPPKQRIDGIKPEANKKIKPTKRKSGKMR
jgi:hypothetical protein